ncbi:hypothetical protein [Dactylosporangium darangshiense]|uniref:Uncharacterized protein n=1 Tax=Dactylosporangium darangshiense TaxID=579108 RepID=A0ABP8DB51_9ACTN
MRASTEPDEYPSDRLGAGPPSDGGIRSGTAYVKSPDCPPDVHDPAGDNDVCRKSPACDEFPAANANTEPSTTPAAPSTENDDGDDPADAGAIVNCGADTIDEVSTFVAPGTGVCS